MKVRGLDKILTNEDGVDYTDGTTFKKALQVAATAPIQKEESADAKYKLGMIAVKLGQARKGIVELSAEDITLLKGRVGQIYGPMVVVRLYDMLEGKKPAEARIDPKELEEDEVQVESSK